MTLTGLRTCEFSSKGVEHWNNFQRLPWNDCQHVTRVVPAEFFEIVPTSGAPWWSWVAMVERHSFTMALSTNKHLWAPIWKPVGYIFCKVILGVLNFSSNFWIFSLVLSLGFSRVLPRTSEIFLLGIISYRTSCIYNEPNHYKNWNDFLLTEKMVIKHPETREKLWLLVACSRKVYLETWEAPS